MRHAALVADLVRVRDVLAPVVVAVMTVPVVVRAVGGRSGSGERERDDERRGEGDGEEAHGVCVCVLVVEERRREAGLEEGGVW